MTAPHIPGCAPQGRMGSLSHGSPCSPHPLCSHFGSSPGTPPSHNQGTGWGGGGSKAGQDAANPASGTLPGVAPSPCPAQCLAVMGGTAQPPPLRGVPSSPELKVCSLFPLHAVPLPPRFCGSGQEMEGNAWESGVPNSARCPRQGWPPCSNKEQQHSALLTFKALP